MNRVVEVRSYKLRSGARHAFHRAVKVHSVPMLLRWGTDVVAYGPSVVDESDYFLIRSYASVDDMNQRQDAFYGSLEWQEGPRESIVSLIDYSLNTLLWLSTVAIDDLRRSNAFAAN